MMSAVLEEIIPNRAIESVYQPVVNLDSGETVAYEALARGPAGSPHESPAALFDAAKREGRLDELDAACRSAAVQGAVDVGLPLEVCLFVNVEPTAMTAMDARTWEELQALAPGLRIVLELTERALAGAPAELLVAIERARETGLRIALDDLGVEVNSLALLPLIEPEIVKLDLRLVQGRPDRELARTMASVMAYAERSGAIILAEGIETAEHAEIARALGATLGQGWRLGRPAPLPNAVPRPTAPLALRAGRVRLTSPSPYLAAIDRGLVPRIGRKRLLLQISHQFEAQALADPNAPVLVAAFQRADRFTPATRLRYRLLAEHCALVAALGVGLSHEPAPGVRGAHIAAGDALEAEWAVVVLSNHYAGALLARDLRDTEKDENDRRFAFTVTHDRELVRLAATTLMLRIAAGADR